jgi:methylated-DNA-[protein]-cysteine S-methyltransferase
MHYYDDMPTPLGRLRLVVDDEGALTCVDLPTSRHFHAAAVGGVHDVARLAHVRAQFEAYFAGKLLAFDLPLNARGTPFQQQVWRALRMIDYGETESYAGLAACIGRPTAVRAVGAANGANPLAIIVPCHRVIGADGNLTGYAGGLDAKRWLLAHERRHAPRRALQLRG